LPTHKGKGFGYTLPTDSREPHKQKFHTGIIQNLGWEFGDTYYRRWQIERNVERGFKKHGRVFKRNSREKKEEPLLGGESPQKVFRELPRRTNWCGGIWAREFELDLGTFNPKDL